MRSNHYWLLLLVLVLLLLIPLSMAAKAAPTRIDYDLSWWTVDSGGAMRYQAGDYELSGAIGQPDAYTLSSGGYVLEGGFWAGVSSDNRIYLPMMQKQTP